MRCQIILMTLIFLTPKIRNLYNTVTLRIMIIHSKQFILFTFFATPRSHLHPQREEHVRYLVI